MHCRTRMQHRYAMLRRAPPSTSEDAAPLLHDIQSVRRRPPAEETNPKIRTLAPSRSPSLQALTILLIAVGACEALLKNEGCLVCAHESSVSILVACRTLAANQFISIENAMLSRHPISPMNEERSHTFQCVRLGILKSKQGPRIQEFQRIA